MYTRRYPTPPSHLTPPPDYSGTAMRQRQEEEEVLIPPPPATPEAEEAAEELVAMGLIVPDSDASALARRCVAKLWGRNRIAAELYEKGYSSNAVDAAMAYLEDSQIDFVGNCRALIGKRYDTLPSDITERKRLYAALCRYGYSSSEIKQAMESMRPDR